MIKDLLTRLAFEGKDRHADLPDPNIVFSSNEDAVRNGWLEK